MSESLGLVDDLDRPIYGAKNIGAIVNLNERQAYHALEQGYLDGDKFGRKWRSSKRRLLKTPEPQTHSSRKVADSPSKTAPKTSSCESPVEQSPPIAPSL